MKHLNSRIHTLKDNSNQTEKLISFGSKFLIALFIVVSGVSLVMAVIEQTRRANKSLADACLQFNYGWTRVIGSSSYETTEGVAVYTDNSSYITGSIITGTTLDFDATSGTDIHTTVGTRDGYITKYNSDGSYGWTRIIQGAGANIFSLGIETDSSGNVYTTGYFTGTADFDGTSGTDNHTMVSGGNGTRFITKYSPNGNYLWTVTFGKYFSQNNPNYNTYKIAVDNSGNAYVEGSFNSTNEDFDGTSGTDIKSRIGGLSGYFTKYNSDGTYGWTRLIAGGGGVYTYDVAVDNNGDPYIAGSFQAPTTDFDGTPGTDTKSVIGSDDIFLTKYLSNGDYSWTQTIGSINGDYPHAIVSDRNSNIAIVGDIGDEADLDPGIGTDVRGTIGSLSIFLVKLTTSGSYTWGRAFGSYHETSSNLMGIDANTDGDLYVSGNFTSISADFDGTGGTDIKSSSGDADIFLSKYNFDGEYEWTNTLTGNFVDYARGVKWNNGAIYLATSANSSDIDYDPTSGSYSEAYGDYDIALTKFSEDYICEIPPTSPTTLGQFKLDSITEIPAPVENITTDNISFAYTGGVQSYTVPDGITKLEFSVWGAGGGNGGGSAGGTGGLGGYTTGTLDVHSGQQFNILVGGRGQNGGLNSGGAGGYGGGGNGGNVYTAYVGGGGGGRSEITLAESGMKIIVAGGGGGAPGSGNSTYSGGTGGGLTGGDAPDGPGLYSETRVATGGKGGSQTEGGAGGSADVCTGLPGSANNGGNGCISVNGGGGGGGGYFGGGGGVGNNNTYHSGGGGGSGYCNIFTTNCESINGSRSTNGEVIINEISTNNGIYTTNELSVVIQATASSNEESQYWLEVELQPVGQALQDSATATGSPVNNNTVASVTVNGLSDTEQYHWQVRSCDNTGCSGWIQYGDNSNGAGDFQVEQASPANGVIDYINGTTATPIEVSFDPGDDDLSGINYSNSLLQRSIRSLNDGSCTGSDNFTTIAANPLSSYTDNDLIENNCYKYRYLVYDYAGNLTTYTSSSEAIYDLPNNAPNTPTLTQFLSDGSTSLSIGNSTNEDNVVLKGTSIDVDGDNFVLEVEIQEIGTSFSNVRNIDIGSTASSGNLSTTTAINLIDDTSYHWQARSCDIYDACSAWVSFGGNNENTADFTINLPPPPNDAPNTPTLTQYYADNSGVVSTGSTIVDTSIRLHGQSTDNNADNYYVEFEIQPIGTEFSNQVTNSSSITSSGTMVSILIDSLTNGTSYHWQARSCDSSNCSDWVPYGGNSELTADFTVQVIVTSSSTTSSASSSSSSTSTTSSQSSSSSSTSTTTTSPSYSTSSSSSQTTSEPSSSTSSQIPSIDSDGDQLPDNWEIENVLNPNDPGDAILDNDGDGLTNIQEYQNSTDPNDTDSDDDGMQDNWEIINNFDPLDPSDASEDADNDGFTNLEECNLGTDPNDSGSAPQSSSSSTSSSSTNIINLPNTGGGTIINPIAENVQKVIENVFIEDSPSLEKFIEQLPSTGNRNVDESIKTSIKIGIPTVKVTSATIIFGTVFAAANGTNLFGSPNLLLVGIPPIFRRRRDKQIGIVYDAESNEPIPFAVIRVYDNITKQQVLQRVSDLKGRYSFVLSTGNYTIIVDHEDYDKFEAPVNISNEELSINLDVSMYKKSQSKNTFKKAWQNVKSFIREKSGTILTVIFFIGFPISIASVIINPNVYNIANLAFYALINLMYLYYYITQPRNWGYIYDANSGRRVGNAFVRLFNLKDKKLIDTQMTDANGRYGFIVDPGEYLLLVNAKGYKFPSVKTSNDDLEKTFYGSLLKVRITKTKISNFAVPLDKNISMSGIQTQSVLFASPFH